MNKNTKLIVVILLVAISLGIIYIIKKNYNPNSHTQVATEVELEVGFEEALKNGKATLLEFRTDNCPACANMEPVIEELKREYPDKLNIVVLNLSERKENELKLAQQYNIRYVPTFVLFDKNGNQINVNDSSGKNVNIIEGAVYKDFIIHTFKEGGVDV